MSAWAWVVIAVVAVVVIAVVAGMIGRRRRVRRSEHLQSTFGPEYYRVAVDGRGRPSRKGEEELLRREQQRARFDVRPLSSDQQQRYLRAWRDIQTTFVDTPQRSVAEAETLVTQVMQARGYPVDDFEDQAALISVDHPDLVNNYRRAHRVYERSLHEAADTEELRSSLVYYRSLFNELLAA